MRHKRPHAWGSRHWYRHFQGTGWQSGQRRPLLRGIYRSRSGMILGVCKGLAQHFDVSVRWTRILTLLAFIFTGFWPVGLAYLALGMLLKPEPVVPPAAEGDEEFYRSYTGSRSMALSRLKRTYDRLDRRIQHIEDLVTSREFDWEGRLNR